MGASSSRFWRVIYCILSIEKCTDQDIAKLLDFPVEEVAAYRAYMKSVFRSSKTRENVSKVSGLQPES